MTDTDKILVVDDTPASLKLLTVLLKEEGYAVRSAINGQLALNAALFALNVARASDEGQPPRYPSAADGESET